MICKLQDKTRNALAEVSIIESWNIIDSQTSSEKEHFQSNVTLEESPFQTLKHLRKTTEPKKLILWTY